MNDRKKKLFMKNIQTTHGQHLTISYHFRKNGKIILSLYCDKNYHDNQFDTGSFTVQNEKTSMQFGECSFHHEEELDKQFTFILEQYIYMADFDDYTKHEDKSEKFIVRKGE